MWFKRKKITNPHTYGIGKNQYKVSRLYTASESNNSCVMHLTFRAAGGVRDSNMEIELPHNLGGDASTDDKLLVVQDSLDNLIDFLIYFRANRMKELR